MSFAADVQTARDTSRPRVDRERALARCVRRYAPFGLLATFGHLDRHADADDPSHRLIQAVTLLEASRAAWHAEFARFGTARKAAKARGSRRVTASELSAYASFGWPGDPEAAPGRALDEQFLRTYGMALWRPEPVNLRRQIRRARRQLQTPQRFDGCFFSCLVAGLLLFSLVVWVVAALFDFPRAFWYGFMPGLTLCLGLSVAGGFWEAARSVPAIVQNNVQVAARLRVLEDRLRSGDPGAAEPAT
jgi:hypothetical protein